jgi:hypothetical protein
MTVWRGRGKKPRKVLMIYVTETCKVYMVLYVTFMWGNNLQNWFLPSIKARIILFINNNISKKTNLNKRYSLIRFILYRNTGTGLISNRGGNMKRFWQINRQKCKYRWQVILIDIYIDWYILIDIYRDFFSSSDDVYYWIRSSLVKSKKCTIKPMNLIAKISNFFWVK